jgi:hypothetical protein
MTLALMFVAAVDAGQRFVKTCEPSEAVYETRR